MGEFSLRFQGLVSSQAVTAELDIVPPTFMLLIDGRWRGDTAALCSRPAGRRLASPASPQRQQKMPVSQHFTAEIFAGRCNIARRGPVYARSDDDARGGFYFRWASRCRQQMMMQARKAPRVDLRRMRIAPFDAFRGGRGASARAGDLRAD